MLPTKSPDVYTVVAGALGCSPDSLTIESRMYQDHGWDSFGHVSVMTAIEEEYGIAIEDHLLTKLTTMKAIVEFLSTREKSRHDGVTQSFRQ